MGPPLIVADTNLIVYLLVRGQETPEAERAYEIDSKWVAPDLWRSEFRNALALYVRNGQLGLDEAVQHMAHAERLVDAGSRPIDSAKVLSLATQTGCSAYDCEYVALAQDLGVTLVTADRKLASKFKPTAVHLRDFVRSSRR